MGISYVPFDNSIGCTVDALAHSLVRKNCRRVLIRAACKHVPPCFLLILDACENKVYFLTAVLLNIMNIDF